MKTVFYPLALVSIVASLSLANGSNYIVSRVQESPFGDGYWTVSSIIIDPALDVNFDGKPDPDLRILIPLCEQDDAESYRSDGYIIINRGESQCEEEEENLEEIGTWSYDEKAKKLIVEKNDSSNAVEAFLESASPSEIIFVSKHESSAGIHTIRTTLKLQKR